jgi:hypothetical protein
MCRHTLHQPSHLGSIKSHAVPFRLFRHHSLLSHNFVHIKDMNLATLWYQQDLVCLKNKQGTCLEQEIFGERNQYF